jgi:replicative DNA helicase
MTLSDSLEVWTAAERALVGMLLKNGQELTGVLSRGISPASFFDDISRQLFAYILSADKEGRTLSTLDATTLIPGEATTIREIVYSSPITQNISFYADEVAKAAWQREMREVLVSLEHMVLTREPYGKIDHIKARAVQALERFAYGEEQGGKGPKGLGALLERVLPEIEAQIEAFKLGHLSGIPTGLSAVDQITGGGLKPGHYTIIAARPGIGKTALAVFMASKAAAAGFRSLFFTVEMTAPEISRRFLALESRVAGSKIDLGKLGEGELDRLHQANKSLHDSLVEIDDSTGGNFEVFEATCRRVKRQRGLSVVVLDYLQLFTLGKSSANRVGMLTEVSNRLKRLALELQIAVVVLSQINREADREEGTPSLHQLKDTGALEQDADLALLLYKDRDQIMASVAKNRRGKWGFVFPLKADLAINHFETERLQP